MPISFYLQSQKNPAGIYVRIREGRKTKNYEGIDAKARTMYVVNPKHFKKGATQNLNIPKNSSVQQKNTIQEINIALLELQRNLDDLKLRLQSALNERKEYERINSAWLKNFLIPASQEEAPSTLGEYFGYFIKEKANELAPGTVKKLRTFEQRILRYEKDTNAPIYIQEVDRQFAKKMQRWCTKENYAHNTTVKTIKQILTVCNHARENGISTHPELPYLTKGLTYKKSPHIHLSFKELEILQRLEIKNDRMDAARDWLVISCFTAQRVSDFLKFNPKHFVTINGIKCIDIDQEKTGNPIYIPVSDEVDDILRKYNGSFPPSFSQNVNSNETIYNRLIKQVCKQAGFKDLVTANIRNPKTNRYEIREVPKYKAVSSHIGRRSFATNFYGEVHTSLLISATGHSSEREFRRYVGKAPKERVEMLAKGLKRATNKNVENPRLKIASQKAKGA